MDKTKVVTFRISEEELSALDDFKKTHFYWKRSFIICAILWAFFHMTTAGTRFEIIRQCFKQRPKYRIVLEELEPKEGKE